MELVLCFFILNEASDDTLTRMNELVRLTHEVSDIFITNRRLMDPVHVTFNDAGKAVRRDGKSQATTVPDCDCENLEKVRPRSEVK